MVTTLFDVEVGLSFVDLLQMGNANLGVNDGLNTVYDGSAQATGLQLSRTAVGGLWNGTPVDILYGGSGATTANDALNAFLPAQTGNAGKVLETDGTNASWASVSAGGVSSVSNSDGSLTVSPTTGAVEVSVNLIHSFVWANTQSITAAGSPAFSVKSSGSGAQDTFQVITPGGSDIVTGFAIAGTTAGGGASLTVISSASDEPGTIDAKGSGTLALQGTATGLATVGHGLSVNSGAAGTIGLLVTGAASQSADLLKLTSNTGVGTADFLASGSVTIQNTGSAANLPILKIQGGGGAANKVSLDLTPYYARTGGSACRIVATDDGGSAGYLSFYTAATGSGTTSTERIRLDTTGHLLWPTDNTYDVGASGATRPRDLFLGRDLAVGRNETVAGTVTVTSASASALAVGPNGATNPVLKVDCSTGSAATGISITAKAAGNGCSFAVISSGSNEALLIDAKGTASVLIGSTSSGSIGIAGNGQDVVLGYTASRVAVQSTSSAGFLVSQSGPTATNGAFRIDCSAPPGTGVLITPNTAGSGVNLAAMSTGTNEDFIIDAKGSGIVKLATVSTGGARIDGKFGFGVTPAAQQTGGAATAGALYTATEQGMIQKAYDCLRTFGFLT